MKNCYVIVDCTKMVSFCALFCLNRLVVFAHANNQCSLVTVSCKC